MKAVCIESSNGGAVLVLRHVPMPEIGPDEVLVKVKASGLNFADLYRQPDHFGGAVVGFAVAGLELAGEIVEVGDNATGWRVGDRVMAGAKGAYAEYCKVNHRLLMRVPSALDWECAAAIPVTFMTAHDALSTNGELRPGEALLVQAASSGVGIAAVQMARLLGAGLIIGTSTSPSKLERLEALGLDIGLSPKDAGLARAVLDATSGNGVDVILDNIGGDTLPANVECAAVKGRIVNVGRLGNWNGTINLDEHARKRLKLIGVSFRTRSLEEQAMVAQLFERTAMGAIENGNLKPVVDKVFELTDAEGAQDYLRSGAHFGKVILRP